MRDFHKDEIKAEMLKGHDLTVCTDCTDIRNFKIK